MEYYILINGQKQGPFSEEELKKQGINRNSMIWREGLPDWKPANQLTELQELLNTLPPEAPKEQPKISPKTWLVESILVTCLCCLPFGIAGIIYASKVSSSFAAGHYEEAEIASANAGKWTKIGFIVGLVVIICYMIFYGVTIATLVSNS